MQNKIIKSGKWEMGNGKWEMRSGKWNRSFPLSEFRLPLSEFRLPTSLRLLVGLWFFFLPILGTAQTLTELMEMARNSNPELKALNQEYLAALERAPQVSQLPDPEVGLGAFVAPVETRLGAQRARLSASQMFPWFGTLETRKEVAIANAQPLFERVASRELELFYQVKEAYFQLYELDQAQLILNRSIGILEGLRRLSLSKVESGKASSADVLRIDLKIQELEQELDILERNKIKPLADLNQVLNRPLATPVVMQDSLTFAILPFEKDTLRQHISRHHPMIRMFSLQQEASQKALALNKLDGKPSFGIGMDYIMVDPRSDAAPANNGKDIFQISARVSLPLNRKKYKAKEREEQLKIEAIENRKSDVVNRFLSMIEKAYTDYETASLRQALYTQQIATSKAAIRILQTNYSTTGSRFDELLQLEKELIDYDLKILKTIVQSQIAKAGIERYIY